MDLKDIRRANLEALARGFPKKKDFAARIHKTARRLERIKNISL